MNRRVIGWTCGVAVLLAAALAVGCGRDAGGPERSVGPAAPAARLAEGAVVRATLRDAVVAPREGSAPSLLEFDPAPAEAVVAHGRAVDASCGALLAAGAWGAGARELRHDDATAHVHRLLVRAPGNGPVEAVRYERDGEVLAEAAYRWGAVGDGFVLRERVLTLFSHGRVLLRQVRRADAPSVLAAAAAASTDVPDGPRPLLAAMAPDCSKEWAVYIGASATMILAGEVYTLIPNPATGSALVTAIGAWEKALNNLLDCQARLAL